MDHIQHMEKSERDMVVEARVEVNAARKNLDHAIAAWDKWFASAPPANLELGAARARMERANALLRSALGDQD